jgi:hypothetical protein
MRVGNRVVLTPHGHLVSSLRGSEKDAERHIAYWRARAEAGWVDGVSAQLRNPLPPGFEPIGVGANPRPLPAAEFVDRVGRLADVRREQDTRLTVQMILQRHAARGVGGAQRAGLACSAVPDSGLSDELTAREVGHHVLADGFAPRRLAWATKQAYDLAARL